jgi:hypothetical protein
MVQAPPVKAVNMDSLSYYKNHEKSLPKGPSNVDLS